MTSKCGKNKRVTHEAIAECVTVVATWNLFVLYNKVTFCGSFSGARLRLPEFESFSTNKRIFFSTVW